MGFDPTDEKWSRGDEGEFWRFSGESDGVPWRCTIRWVDGGWTQLVGLEFGEVVVEDPNLVFGPDGRASGVDRRGNPFAFRPLENGDVHSVVELLFHGLRDAELGASLAAVMQSLGDEGADVHPRLQSALHTLGGRGQEDHAIGLAAAVYGLFVRRGAPDPTVKTAKALNVSRATAARRIKQARDNGLLGAARPGKAFIADGIAQADAPPSERADEGRGA